MNMNLSVEKPHTKPYFVKAIWDDDASVYYSQSDIPGLHIETDNLDDFELVLFDVAAELIATNCISKEDFVNKPLKELIPSFGFIRPADIRASA